jgi:hypothetical protein
MKIRISYPLSAETCPEYEAAIEKVRKRQQDEGARVVDVEIKEIKPGQFAGVIVLEVGV